LAGPKRDISTQDAKTVQKGRPCSKSKKQLTDKEGEEDFQDTRLTRKRGEQGGPKVKKSKRNAGVSKNRKRTLKGKGTSHEAQPRTAPKEEKFLRS